ncbi:hypothetical protein EYF80_015918 [Liparis tanakae]|uniref:Uncharacterized protein n=1 Tax=Liparis tanakae TaxID=230148 RepID=A0A4Z2I7X5_9TELE|nr:hypothetical protein EYF80_015918 [Liparis tanakae]
MGLDTSVEEWNTKDYEEEDLETVKGIYLQCTTMGLFPDCCCCLCTEAMMSIMPFPSAGMPISGQPWKWKCLITLVCFSFEKK